MAGMYSPGGALGLGVFLGPVLASRGRLASGSGQAHASGWVSRACAEFPAIGNS